MGGAIGQSVNVITSANIPANSKKLSLIPQAHRSTNFTNPERVLLKTREDETDTMSVSNFKTERKLPNERSIRHTSRRRQASTCLTLSTKKKLSNKIAKNQKSNKPFGQTNTKPLTSGGLD